MVRRADRQPKRLTDRQIKFIKTFQIYWKALKCTIVLNVIHKKGIVYIFILITLLKYEISTSSFKNKWFNWDSFFTLNKKRNLSRT